MKKIYYILISFLLVFGIMICSRDSSDIKYFDVTQTLTMFNNKVYLFSDEGIYEYKYEKAWKRVESDVTVIQVIDGEIPCAIDTNGKILFEELPEQEDILSLSSAYAYEMARKLLEINEEQKFLCLSDSLLCSPVALLEGNVLLYPRSGQYETYQMEEEVQMLSGNYVLTKSGNVCRVASESPAWDENVVRSVYDGGDIVAIGADQNSGLCIGVSEQGNIVSIECSSARAQKVQEEVGAWNDLVNIAVSDTKVCGVKADGECIEITY